MNIDGIRIKTTKREKTTKAMDKSSPSAPVVPYLRVKKVETIISIMPSMNIDSNSEKNIRFSR